MTTTDPFRVLVVEDEYYIADETVRALRDGGIVVIGPVASVSAAIAAIEGGAVDFAVVDINLEGSMSYEVAAKLRERGIPFLFNTGYDRSVLPAAFQDAVILQKPQSGEAVLAEVQRQRATREILK